MGHWLEICKATVMACVRERRSLTAMALAALVLSGVAEILYRGYWATKQPWPLRNDKSGAFSLYVVGESTAAGEPYNAQSPAAGRPITLAALVRNLLGRRFQGRELQEFNLARNGDSVYPQSVALEQALRLRKSNAPGVVLIYAGHNDAMEPRGTMPLEWFRAKILCRSMLLGDLSFYAEKKLPFLRVRTQQTYEHHLRRIVEMSLKSGLVPIVTVVASNISGIDPGLFPEEALPRKFPNPFRRSLPCEMAAILGKGLEMEARGRAGEAIPYYLAQAGAHPQMRAYLEYRTGKCYQALGRYMEARQFYRQVIELSAFDNFPRATSRQNNFIRALAKQYGIPLVDAVEILERHSPHGLLGNELFSDGVHPNIKGYLLLANAYAGKIRSIFNEPPGRQWTGPGEVFRFFAYGRERQADALITSGRYLFNIAARHAWPVERLKMARTHFRSALELDPDSFSAWMALGWVEIAMHSTLLSDSESLYWLLEHGLLTYHFGKYGIAPHKLTEVLEKLASYGTPDSIAAEIPRNAALKLGLSPGNSGEYSVSRGRLLQILKKLYNVPAAARRGNKRSYFSWLRHPAPVFSRIPAPVEYQPAT